VSGTINNDAMFTRIACT